MSIPVELLTAAGLAVAGSMGTDVYHYARGRLKEIVSGEGSDDPIEIQRLDTLAQAVTAVPVDQRPIIAKGIQVPVEEIIGECITDARQVSELQELVRILDEKLQTSASNITSQTVTDNFAGGNINTAGRDNIIGGGR